MTPGRVLAELTGLAGRLGIAVRVEAFPKRALGRRGGLCRVDGQAMIVMDEKLALEDRIGVMAEALKAFEWEKESLPLAVRERIEAAKGGKKGVRKRSRPGLARAKPRKG